MPVPTHVNEFHSLVRAFFESTGYETESSSRTPHLIHASPRLDQHIEGEVAPDRTAGASLLISLPTLSRQEESEQVDLAIDDDSPLAASSSHHQRGGIPFARRILFPAWRDFVHQELHKLTESGYPDGSTLAPQEEGVEGSNHRLLLCGDRDEDLEKLLRHQRREMFRVLLDEAGDLQSQSFILPLSLDPFLVRELGLILAIRDRLLAATKVPFMEEVYLGALRCGYLHVFVDWINDWNLNGDIDPNHGMVAELLHALGPTGRFSIGCDKTNVYHYVCRELVGDRKSDHRFRTLGERFAWDGNLCLKILQSTPGSGKQHSSEAYKRTKGLFGPDDWSGLLRDLAALAYSMERPDYLSDHMVYQAIRERLHPNRRLSSNTNVVMRTLHGSGLFDYNPKLGLRFRSSHVAEELFADQLHLAFEDLREYGHQGEDGRTLLRVIDLLTAPQCNERLLFKALEKYGHKRGGPEGCKELVLDYLAIALHKDYPDVRDDFQLRQFRLGVLRVIIVLNAWLHSKGLQTIRSLGGDRIDLSRIDGPQLYVFGLDLSHANISNATIPFACFDQCTLDGTDFSTAYLPSAKIVAGTQRNANFERADLTATILTRGNYEGAEFQGASLWAANLSESHKLTESQIGAAETNLTRRPAGERSTQLDVDLPMVEACLRTFYETSHQDEKITPDRVPASPTKIGFSPLWHCRHPGIALIHCPERANEPGGDLSIRFLAANGKKQKEQRVAFVRRYHRWSRWVGRDSNPDKLTLAYVKRDGTLIVRRALTSTYELQQERTVQCPENLLQDKNGHALRILDDHRSIAIGLANARILVLSYPHPLDELPPDASAQASYFGLPGEGRVQPTIEALHDISDASTRYLFVGWSDGRITVFNLDEEPNSALKPHPPLAEFIGVTPPVDLAYVESHRQLIVARIDSSVEILYFSPSATLQRLTTFQLAHEEIHSILCYPGQARYLIAGLAYEKTFQAGERRVPSTLFAMCNGSLQVLAVWSQKDKTGKRLDYKSLETQLNQYLEFEKNRATESHASVDVIDLSFQKFRELKKLFASGELKMLQDGSQGKSGVNTGVLDSRRVTKHSGVVTFMFTIPKPFHCSHSGPIPLGKLTTVSVEGEVCHLRIPVALLRYSPDGSQVQLKREIRQDVIDIFDASEIIDPENEPLDRSLLLRFRHPLLEKSSTLMLTHAAQAQFIFQLEAIDSGPAPQPFTYKFTPERPNPFRNYAMPVSGAEFYANRDIVNRLQMNLLRGGGAFIIQGARRSGKSSILLQLQTMLEENENVFVVRFDLRESDRNNISELFRRIVHGIPQALQRRRKAGLDPERVLNGTSTANPLLRTVEILKEIKIDNPIIVVMLDEWGHLFGASRGLHINRQVRKELGEFYGELRSQIPEVKNNYRFLFAGLPWHFDDTLPATTSSGLASYILERAILRPVDDSVVKDMIHDKLGRESLTIREKAMRECLRLASGQLHDANLLIYFAVESMFSEKGREVRKQHIHDAKEKLVNHYDQYRKALWEGLGEEAKKWIETEVREGVPAWERSRLTRQDRAPVDLTPFFSMAYTRYDSEIRAEVLFVPTGLKLCIARAAGRPPTRM